MILCSVLSVELTDIYRYTYHCTIKVIGHYDLAGIRLTALVFIIIFSISFIQNDGYIVKDGGVNGFSNLRRFLSRFITPTSHIWRLHQNTSIEHH